MGNSEAAVSLAFVLAFIALFVLVYFLPTFIAMLRGHHNAAAIAAVNILFGWTFLGWGIAFVWALTSPPDQRPYVVMRTPQPMLYSRPAVPPDAIEHAAQDLKCDRKPQKVWKRVGRGR